MTGLAMVERALAPANDSVRAGLQVQIRLRSHWFHDVHDRRKTRGRVPRFRKLSHFDVFRPNPKHHWFAQKFTRLRSIGESHLDCSTLHFIEQKNLRLSHDGAPYRDALSLSAGERFRFAIEQSFNSKNARRIPHALLDFGFAVFP